MFWLDGTLSADGKRSFDLADRGLLLGDGVFDTSLVLGGRMVWRTAHIERLAAACATLGFALDRPEVDRAIDGLVAAVPYGALRISVTRGIGPRGLAPPRETRPRIFGSIAPLGARPFAPLSFAIAAIRRNETSPCSRMKTFFYLDAILALDAAKAEGFDDALFLNTKGTVACASTGNVLALIGTQLVTPPLADGVMPGIVRGALLRLCKTVGLEPIERSLTPDDLTAACAVFVTNSLKLMAPITRLGSFEKAPCTDLRCAALITALCRAIADDCGIDPRHSLREA